MPKYVYRFSEGNMNQQDLRGGKGANLAEMAKIGLPVPPGFTITTEACRAYMRDGEVRAVTEGVERGATRRRSNARPPARPTHEDDVA